VMIMLDEARLSNQARRGVPHLEQPNGPQIITDLARAIDGIGRYDKPVGTQREGMRVYRWMLDAGYRINKVNDGVL